MLDPNSGEYGKDLVKDLGVPGDKIFEGGGATKPVETNPGPITPLDPPTDIPVKPYDPNQPDPDNPNNPEDPDNPNTPDDPDNPDNPDSPNIPDSPYGKLRTVLFCK